MFMAVNHPDRKVIVAYKGTSRGMDILLDAEMAGRSVPIIGEAVSVVSNVVMSACGWFNTHRFNSA